VRPLDWLDDLRAEPAMSRERWMAAFLATGSLCFLIDPFPGYATSDAVTFFAGSVLFTVGSALQVITPFRRRAPPPARVA
jgi:hypothetical protein